MSLSTHSGLCGALVATGLALVAALLVGAGQGDDDRARSPFLPRAEVIRPAGPATLVGVLDEGRLDATADGRPRSVSVVELSVPTVCARASLEQQAPGPLHLALPADPLLDEAASPEDLQRWYAGLPTSELVRDLARFRGLQTVLRVYQEGGLDDLALDPRARWMLSRPAAVEAEAAWLTARLAEERAGPFYGPLPVRLGEDEEDYSRQLGTPDRERLALLLHELDHALRYERDRHYEAAFLAGRYTARTFDSLTA